MPILMVNQSGEINSICIDDYEEVISPAEHECD